MTIPAGAQAPQAHSRLAPAVALSAQSGVPEIAPRAGIVDVSWRSMDNPTAIAAWDELANRAAEANPFFESWYLLPSLHALDPLCTVRLLRFESGGQLVGLMPVKAELGYYGRPIPHLAGWLHPNSFLGVPLVAKGHEADFWRALLAWGDENAGLSLFLHLSHMPLDSSVLEPLRAACIEQRRPMALVHREERAMLQSTLSPEDYLDAALTGKKRKELRRQHARLAELGQLAIERLHDGTDVAAWCSRFLELERGGWKGRARSALATTPETESLFRHAIMGAAARGRLERLSLMLDGQPIAMLASFLAAPAAFSFKTAFDERFARFSPGVLLQRENLAMLKRPEITFYDSCAAANHPMIDRIWRERRAIGRLSIGIGGGMRRALFGQLSRIERSRSALSATPPSFPHEVTDLPT